MTLHASAVFFCRFLMFVCDFAISPASHYHFGHFWVCCLMLVVGVCAIWYEFWLAIQVYVYVNMCLLCLTINKNDSWSFFMDSRELIFLCFALVFLFFLVPSQLFCTYPCTYWTFFACLCVFDDVACKCGAFVLLIDVFLWLCNLPCK